MAGGVHTTSILLSALHEMTQTLSPYTRDELEEVSSALGERTTDHVKEPLTIITTNSMWLGK